MAKVTPPTERPAEEYPQPSYVADEFWGVGGSYLLDPVTGKRSRVIDPDAQPLPPVLNPEEMTDATL